MTRRRILTGDTPTGRLHLGHWVGSLENRVRLQADHECYFLVANIHAFTTRAKEPGAIRQDTLEIVKDWLACGIDPERATLVLQSEIPAIAELTVLFAMLLPFNRVLRNPTLKDELDTKGLGDHYSFGFPLYAVGQCADILAFRADLVPVGEDQLAHIEMAREVARKFEERYGAVFPVPEGLVGRVARLRGTDGVKKMSKSLGNAIFLADSADDIKKKIARVPTGRMAMTDPGDPTNVLFEYARIFIADAPHVDALADRYARGDNIGDKVIRDEVAAAIEAFVAPIRERRAGITDAYVTELLRDHAQRANRLAGETLARAKAAMHLAL